MSDILSILKSVAAVGSTKKKLTIVQSHKDNDTLRNVFRLAYNKRIVFGIKKIPEKIQLYRGICTLDSALDELEHRFATRKITGNDAIGRLGEMLGMMPGGDREVLIRVIKRDLSIGCSESTANKVWGKDLIPSQPCMKASAYSDKALLKIQFPALAQLKADGTRCMIIKQNGIVSAYSRNGKQFLDLPIFKSIEDSEFDNFVLDGELVYKDVGINSSVSIVSGDLSALFGNIKPEKDEVSVVDRQTGNGIISKSQKGTITKKEAENVHFQVWDFIEAEDYWNGIWKVDYEVRLSMATNMVQQLDSRIMMIESSTVHNIQQARELYAMYVEQGLEGIILKNFKGFWEDTRSKNQIKFKEVITVDLIIVGKYVHKKDPNKIGGLTVESKCGQIRCNVGSGFSDTDYEKTSDIDEDGENIWEYIPLRNRPENDRELIMANYEDYDGKVAELECNACIARKNPKPGEAPFKLFLPVFCHVRFDKDANDANTKEEVFG